MNKDTRAFEQILLDAAESAVETIEKKLCKHWDDYKGAERVEGGPAVFDVFEHVVQFEVAWKLQKKLNKHEISRFAYCSWECDLSSESKKKIDLVVAKNRTNAESGTRRTPIEIKWSTSRSGGVDGAASDCLKLAVADARPTRYVLLTTDRTPRKARDLESAVRAAMEGVQWRESDQALLAQARDVSRRDGFKIDVVADERTALGRVSLLRITVPDVE